jgi:hypothetical protein
VVEPIPDKMGVPSGDRKRYSVWFGVGFDVQADTSEEAEKQARQWLENVLFNADRADGISLVSVPLDLMEAAVRTLQTMAKEHAAAGETGVSFLIQPLPSPPIPETKISGEFG